MQKLSRLNCSRPLSVYSVSTPLSLICSSTASPVFCNTPCSCPSYPTSNWFDASRKLMRIFSDRFSGWHETPLVFGNNLSKHQHQRNKYFLIHQIYEKILGLCVVSLPNCRVYSYICRRRINEVIPNRGIVISRTICTFPIFFRTRTFVKTNLNTCNSSVIKSKDKDN